MKRKGLMRRVLASILCATLVFQNVSVTAYATETAAEPVTEISTEEASEEASEEKVSEEKASETQSSESEPAEESEAVVVVDEEADAEKEEEVSAQGTTPVAETETQTQTQETTPVEKAFAEIKINENNLSTKAIAEGFEYDIDSKTVIAEYTEEENVFGILLYYTKGNVIDVETEDGSNEELKDKLSHKWQSKKEDGTYADMAADAVPSAVGEYKLVFSLDQKFGKSEAVSINFTIKKAVITVGYDTDKFNVSKKSGTTVKEIKDELTKALTVTNSDSDEFDWDTYVKAYTITVRETTGTEALADDFVLKKGNDYSVDVTAELADAYTANYELKQSNIINLKINELKETALTITTAVVENEKDITRIYDGNPVSEPTVTAAEGETPEMTVEVTVVGEADEATGEDKVLEVAYDNLIKTWYDADYNALEAAPTDAGVYYFELKYTDTEGIYDESSDIVKVVVEPKTIVLKPSTDVTEFFVGNTAYDVTSNVVYTLANTDDSAFDGWDKETFWGVSYNNPELPQSYAPVFELQRGTTLKAEEGKEAVTTWAKVTGKITIPTGTDEDGTKTEYRIVFAGTKGLYDEYGNIYNVVKANDTSVNSADKNHAVDISKETIEKYTIAVTVNANANATIDTTAMLVEGLAEESFGDLVKVYSKIYDGTSIYADRAAYKKAVVKDKDGNEIVKDTADELTYTWYTLDIEEYTDEEGNIKYEAIPSYNIHDYTVYNELPCRAGLYALEVSYDDSVDKYVAEKAYIYFEIDKQLIKVIPEGTPEVYENSSISSFVSGEVYDVDYKVYMIPGNDTALAKDKLVEIPEWSSEEYWKSYSQDYYGRPYDLDWFVLKGDNTDKNVAKYARVYSESELFNMAIPYKLGVELDFVCYCSGYECYCNNHNLADSYEVIVDEASYTEWTCDKLDITVKPEAEIELAVRFDSSKLTAEMLEKTYDGRPIDISEAIANGFVIVTNKKTGEEIPVTGENALELNYTWRYYEYNATVTSVNPINAHEYTLYVSYAGNDMYKPIANTQYTENTFVINPRELTITPAVNETIVAGWNMDDSSDRAKIIDNTKPVIEGYIEEDAAAFAYTESISDVLAFESGISTKITDKNGKQPYNGYLRTGTDYRASYDRIVLNENELKDEYEGNYTIVYKSVKFTPNKRGNSEVMVLGTGDIGLKEIRSRIVYGDLSVEVKPMEGIPYFYAIREALALDEDGDFEPGNYLLLSVQAPKEFDAEASYSLLRNAVYKNSVENAGGIVALETGKGFLAIFDAAEPESGDNIRTFDIIWEDGYTESFTVDLTEAELEDDLRTAVVPKTLAFNGVNSKMVVGENQQLDVKFTKYLIDDVVSFNYAVVAGEDVVSVTDTGYLTALKKGSATVEVYPVKHDNKGNEIRLDYKAVTTKITVSDVTAPKTNSVYAYDYYAAVTYTVPANGYRREMYVLEGKGLKPADFEAKIAAMNQGKFDGIMVGCVEEDDNYIKDDQVMYYIGGLEPNKDYTVYVRNVSGIRTNAQDGFVVSSKAGTVKSFKTTKVQIHNLELYYDENQPIEYNYEEGRDEIKLSSKSFKVNSRGWFIYKPENSAADYQDEVGYELPLVKQQQETYVNPKLTYYAVDAWSSDDYIDEKDSYYTLKIGDRYYAPSQIAKADKKGNVKLSGSGRVGIIAYDSISKLYSNICWVYVTSPVTKITAKKITLKVAEPLYLSDYLTFFDGKTKIKLDYGTTFKTTAELVSGEGVELYPDKDGFHRINAVKSNASAVVKVALADNPEVFVNVNIKTKAMNPVKSLKATNVMNDRATITFTHSVHRYEMPIDYKLEIRDGRNALVSSRLIPNSKFTLDGSKSNYAKRVFAYSYEIEGLVRKSDYKISVTPVYGTETAKAATVKVKTTEIPAYSGELLDKYETGGMDVYYGATDDSIDEVRFTSGKMYTFIADVDWPRDYRPTDTLTWKSSDTKVGTIKANSDNITATFTALKPGYTVIEVSSKLRKGVVARYIVAVKAVGAAGGTEFGDYEINDFDPYYTKSVEVLTESNPVKIITDSYDYTWVKFTAPADGKYTFYVDGYDYYIGPVCKYAPDKEYKYETIDYVYGDEIFIGEGETIYMQVYGSFEMTAYGEKYSKLTTTNTVNSKDSMYVVFTAPEDNYYTFNATRAGMNADYSVLLANGNSYSDYITFRNGESGDEGIRLSKGDKVTFELYNTSSAYDISVSLRKATAAITTTAVDTGEIKAGEEKWFVFKADVAGNYEFNLTDATEGVKAAFYRNGISGTSGNAFNEIIEAPAADDEVVTTADTKKYAYTIALDKDETVAVKVWFEEAQSADPEKPAPTSGTAKISVSLPTVDTIEIGKEKEVTLAKNGETWLSFVVDETGAKYLFDVTGVNVSVQYYKESIYDQISLSNSAYNDVEKGDVIYIKLNNYSDAETKAKVLVSKASATQIKLGEAKDLTVENGKEYVYEFTAPAYGLYAFKADVTANAENGTHAVYANKYNKVNDIWPPSVLAYPDDTNGFYKEVQLTAGQKLVFSVQSNMVITDSEGKAVSTKTKLSVSQVTATELPAEITLDKDSAGDVKWYRFTAKTDDTYTVKLERKDGENYVSGLNGLADVNRAYSLSENLYTVYNEINLIAGESVYFRVVSRNSDKEKAANIRITVAATESLVEEIPTAAFDVKKDETKTFKYTVTKAGRYKVSFKSNTENVNATVTKADRYNASYYNVDNNQEYVFDTIGKTYYFKVTTDNADAEKAASVTLNVTEVTAKDITDETTTVTVKPNEPQWFVYTVPANGRYEFKATTGENEDLYTNIKYYDDILSTSVSHNKSEEWLNREELIYIKLDNSTDKDAIVKFTVKAIQAEAITAGTEKEITLKKGESKWYKFTADETTYYTFKQSAEDGMSIKVSYNLNTAKTDTVLNNEKCLYIQKNDNYYIKVTRTDASDAETLKAKLTIKKETIQKLEAGKELTIKAKSGERKYFKFTAPKSAYYAIGYKNVAEGVTLSNISNYSVVKLNVAGEKAFYADVYFDTTEETKDTEKEFTIYVEEVAPKALALGSEAEITVAKYQKAWYTFEAPEDGIYNFAAESTNEEVLYELYNEDNYHYFYDNGVMPYEEIRMAKGGKLTMAVYYNSNKADKASEKVANSASFKLKVTKTEIKAMAAEGTDVEFDPGAYAWYAYTAAKTGEYKFAIENGSMYIFETLTGADTIASTSIMEAGNTVYIRLSNPNAEKKTVKLTVNCVEAVAFTADKPAEVSFTAEEIEKGITNKWLLFTADKAGRYEFSKEAVEGNMYAYYDGYLGLPYSKIIMKDKTVFISVKADAPAKAKISVVRTWEFTYKTLKLNVSDFVDVEEDGYVYYEFTAPHTGNFRFYSENHTGDPYCELYNENLVFISDDDDDGDGRNFSLIYRMDKGQTVYIKARAYSNGAASYDVNVELY